MSECELAAHRPLRDTHQIITFAAYHLHEPTEDPLFTENMSSGFEHEKVSQSRSGWSLKSALC